MRGQQSLLFLDFSENTRPANAETGEPRKGRSKELIERRNKKIIARYYYHNVLCNKSFVDAVQMLMYEFDLDDRTISLILKKEADTIIKMRKEKPSLKKLKDEHHWPSWGNVNK